MLDDHNVMIKKNPNSVAMIVNVDRIKPFRGTEEPLWVEGIDNNLIQEDRTPIITDIEGNVISCQEKIPDLRHPTGVNLLLST